METTVFQGQVTATKNAVTPPPPPPVTVSVTMPLDTAISLQTVLDNVGGDRQGFRGDLDEISTALHRLGVFGVGSRLRRDQDKGSIYLRDTR